ncbi:hypothetical protein BH23BAC1_BH23BAC1_51000 [soil metagenome]
MVPPKLKSGDNVRGFIMGRFQKDTGMTRELLTIMVHTKKELKNVPVAANIDFGHTAPMATLPIGSTIKMQASVKIYN